MRLEKNNLSENEINTLKDKYNDLYFTDKALIISKKVTYPYPKIELSINNLCVTSKKIYIVIETTEPYSALIGDVRHINFTIEVNQDDIENVTEVVVLK